MKAKILADGGQVLALLFSRHRLPFPNHCHILNSLCSADPTKGVADYDNIDSFPV